MNLQKKQSARFLEVTMRPYKWSQGNCMPDLLCIKALQTWHRKMNKNLKQKKHEVSNEYV